MEAMSKTINTGRTKQGFNFIQAKRSTLTFARLSTLVLRFKLKLDSHQHLLYQFAKAVGIMP